MSDIRSIPRSLLDAVVNIIQEVKVKNLDPMEKKQYEQLKSKLKKDESAIIDLKSGTVKSIKTKDFNPDFQVKITEDHIPDQPEEEKIFDKAKKPEPEIKKEEAEEDEEELDEESDEEDKEELEEAHQISTPWSSSPEPHSAVGHHRLPEFPKHADVVDEMTHIGGVKRDGYRMMLQYPSGHSVFFPSMDEEPAPNLDVLNTLCQILPEDHHDICSLAIVAASHRPHMDPQFKGPKQPLGEIEKE